MSITYKVIQGDTFEIIARKQYGDDLKSNLILQANPGISEPLTIGTLINIPMMSDAPQNIPQRAPSDNPSEAAILISGVRFRFWDSIRITRSIDTIDTVEFSAPFDSDDINFRRTFEPFSYKDISVTVGGDRLFTGTMLTPVPVLENAKKIINVSAYSLPGVLNDCTASSELDTLEFNDQNLFQIVNKLVDPFGISVDFRGLQSDVFDRVAIKPNKKVLSFIVELAKQRNLIVSSSQNGELLLGNSNTFGVPVVTLKQGEPPLLSVTPFFSPQEYYSHITGIEPIIVGLSGSKITVKNPRLNGTVRPLSFTVTDGNESSIKDVVDAKMGRMFGNLVSYSVKLSTWRDPSGDLWEPNTIISLLAPNAMVYNNYNFIIRSVIFEKDSNTEIATLNLILPESFNGEIPNRMPWD